MRKITEDNLNKVMQLQDKGLLTTPKIMEELGVSNSLARSYKDIVQNELLMKEKNETEVKNYLVIGCVHVPFNNKHLTNGILKMLENNTFDGIVIAGDFLDMAALSTYEKNKINKTGVTLEDEYEAGNILLNSFDNRLPSDALKVFIPGNHEAREVKWKADVNNHKYGDMFNPYKALKLEERGYDVFTDYHNDIYHLGSLGIIHGEYYNVHCAKKHLDVFRRNIMFFHTHRTQMYREGDFAAYNCGFLGDINSPCFNYAPRGMKSAWSNGFAVVSLTGEHHHVNMISCVDDTFVYNGVKYGK